MVHNNSFWYFLRRYKRKAKEKLHTYYQNITIQKSHAHFKYGYNAGIWNCITCLDNLETSSLSNLSFGFVEQKVMDIIEEFKSQKFKLRNHNNLKRKFSQTQFQSTSSDEYFSQDDEYFSQDDLSDTDNNLPYYTVRPLQLKTGSAIKRVWFGPCPAIDKEIQKVKKMLK
eukprot:TRINITY_DN2015_c0_g1_i1.p1 TRINITY_DN2015_c0_g1~~TRINITY_DN2015_c0_g1_i1.p1  ORF type:complete len:170 (-),score=36.63 TRINITY_DN2015_c0_g1_i1:125-634(-)